MEVNAERFDKTLHYIPIVIQHLQIVQSELLDLRQRMLTSIEDDSKKGGQDEKDSEESSDNVHRGGDRISRSVLPDGVDA
jgi:hypothetical protein